MEAAKEDLEIKIANEKTAKPRISPEFVAFWLHKFRKLDVRQQSHRKMLIDAFVHAIYLYDDKLVLTFNYKDGTRTITLDDVKEAIKNENSGSDLNCLVAPNKNDPSQALSAEGRFGSFVFYGTVLSPVRLQNTATRAWPSLVQV